MRKKAKYTSIARSIVQSVQDKKSWKEIELTGESGGIGSYTDPTESDEDTIVMDFEELTHVKIPLPPSPIKEVKEVNEYTLDGEYLNTYDSAKEAARNTEATAERIRKCCKGEIKLCKNVKRIFLYREDDIEKRMAEIDAINEEKAKVILKSSIDEYSLTGRLLMVYESQKQAANANHYSSTAIGKCCRGEYPFLGKSVFLYHGANFKDRIPAIKEQKRLDSLKRKRKRPVDMYSVEGKFLKGFLSESDASRATDIHVSYICRCCSGENLTTHGKIFLYTGESISERLNLINDLKEK